MKIRFFAFLMALVPGVASSQAALEKTKPDLVSGVAAGSGIDFGNFIQMMLALAVVGALIRYGLPKLAPLFSKKLSTPLGSSLRIEESASFGAGQICVVQVRGRTLLVGATASSIEMLVDLTEDDRREASEPAFFELLDEQQRSPKAVVSMPAEEPDKIQQALDRLKRIAG